MAKKQTEILYLASLEKARMEEEKPNSVGNRPRTGLWWSIPNRMGGWAVAQSPILGTTITIERLKKRDYISLVEYYKR